MPPGMASLPPGALGGMGGMGISGPVAGGMPSHPGTPFGVASQPPMEGAVDESRSQSFRVYFIILGLAGTLFAAIVVVVLAVVVSVSLGDDSGATGSTKSTSLATNPAPTHAPAQIKDTGVVAPPKITVATPPPRPTRPTTPRAPPPKPVAGPQPISVTIGDASRYTGVEVSCPSGFRQRGSFSGKTATVPGVPLEDCVLTFKGGAPSKTTIRGGQKKTCTWVGAQANCR